ncbi:MAG: DinB family protein, partial [Cyclobacteriaceae bacterium]|nr:DinB family protein [Cyclobacteriaceae bacterium]
MHPQLVHLVDRIESQREAILSSFQSMTPEQFNRTPSTGKWSAAEILSHIIAAEKLSVMYMQKKVQGIRQAKSSGLWEEIKITILVISQRLP